jgi:hypothetical protein
MNVTSSLPRHPRTAEVLPAEEPRRGLTIAVLCLAIAIVYAALFAEARARAVQRAPAAVPAADAPAELTPYTSGLVFDPSVPKADRRWIVQAVAHTRPEAVRLIEHVDYVTTVTADPPPGGTYLGYASPIGSGRYRISLDLARLDRAYRADRELVVVHELGHVVDGRIVPDPLRDRLAAEVPRTGRCPHGYGDCSPPAEKFADTFAKWAFRGAVSYRTDSGYVLPVPPSLEAWGAELEPLERGP